MKFVLDVNVALKWVLTEPDSDLAQSLLDDFALGIRELIAPDVFPIEAAHALTRSERRGLISNAQDRLNAIMANSPDLTFYLPLLGQAVEISRQCRVGVFDCLYIALAEREGCDVVTADQKMINAVVSHYPFVKHLRDV